MSVTVYYQNGSVYKVLPAPVGSYYDARGEIYAATDIVSDGVRYDLTDIKSINSIAVPEYRNVQDMNDTGLGVTGKLEYVLRIHAGLCKERREYDLAIALLSRATKFMLYSDVGWQKKDFYRIADWHEELGNFELSDQWAEWIEIYAPSEYVDVQRHLAEAESLGTDLVYTHWAGAQSGATAKYQGRVYSISGKDKRFPLLPDFMRQGNPICCPHGAFIYYGTRGLLDAIYYKGKDCPAIKTSWRPFVDDRSPTEKANYLAYAKQVAKEKENRIARRVYYRLKFILPDDAPKSLAAFSKMKNANTQKYQELVAKAAAAGFVFPKMTVDVVEPEDPDPNYNGGYSRPPFWFMR